MSIIALAANRLWTLGNRGRASFFHTSIRHPAEAQRKRLLSYLRNNADTAFGRKFHFNVIHSPEDYRKAVPIHAYEDLQPFIDEIAQGKPNVLTREPVRFFTPSSGSSAAEKWIPCTRSLLNEFTMAIAPWINSLFTKWPAAAQGRAYWSISPITTNTAKSSAIPVGFDDDSAYVGGIFKPLVDSTLAVPSSIRHVQDIPTFRYLTLLLLLRARDLSLISIWHPSFLLLLLSAGQEYWDRLLRDIQEGTFTPPSPIPPAAHPVLQRLSRKMPARARELKQLGPDQPSRWWSSLRVISAWTDAHAASSAQHLAALFPGVYFQGKGLLATEGVTSFPMEDLHGNTRHPLAITSHFFEFLAEDGQTLAAQELDQGAIYTVLLTTGGGLYRYDTGDRIQITDRLSETPCIRFLGKAQHVSDLRGEKLNAAFVAEMLKELCTRLGLSPRFLMLAPGSPQPHGSRGYVLFLEAVNCETLPPGVDQSLDELLSRNPHYAYCRALGQLAPARLFLIDHAAEATYLEVCAQNGQRLGNIKPTPLHQGDYWETAFAGHLHVPEASPISQ